MVSVNHIYLHKYQIPNLWRKQKFQPNWGSLSGFVWNKVPPVPQNPVDYDHFPDSKDYFGVYI